MLNAILRLPKVENFDVHYYRHIYYWVGPTLTNALSCPILHYSGLVPVKPRLGLAL